MGIQIYPLNSLVSAKFDTAFREDLTETDMLTNEDIEKLKEALATKEDLVKIVTLEEFDQFRGEIKQDMDGLRESIQTLTVSVDKLEY